MYRLTNLSHTEVAPSLPLPSLPICFGASSSDLIPFQEEEKGNTMGVTGVMHMTDRRSSSLIAHAGRIAELLSATDISYLSVRDGFEDNFASISKMSGSLLAAVLQYDPEAFDFSKASEQEDHQGRRNLCLDKRTLPLSKEDVPGESTYNTVSKHFPLENSGHRPPSVQRLKIKRKEHLNGTASLTCIQGSEHDAILQSLCEVMEGVFERIDLFDEDDGVEGGTYLSLSEMKNLVEAIATAHAKNVLQIVPVDHLVKTVNLFDRHVQRAGGQCVDDDDENDSEVFMVVTSALEAVQASLTIMTHPGMPKQVYKEEVIDRIVEFSRYQIVHSIFTAYDPVYKRLHKGGEMEDDNPDDEEVDMKKGRRKSKVQKMRRSNINKVSGAVSGVLQKICSILGLIKDLLSRQRLMDNSILQLMKTVLATFSVENIQLLQLKAIGVVSMIFSTYPQHRTAIQDEIISLLWKLPSSKRNLRNYHLVDEESKQIQMLTALVLQLVQCSVSLPNEIPEKSVITTTQSDVNDGSNATFKGMDPAMDTSTYFWRNVLQRWTAPKAHEGSDIRSLVENLVIDLLTTLNAPEFPAANVLLQVLCVLLFGSAGLKSKDAGVRASAIELLGQIAARLKHDAIACSMDTLGVFLETQSPDKDKILPKETCVVCGGRKGSKLTVSCDSCFRWFHADCVGVTGHDLIGRGWLCQYCYCKKQLVLLETSLKEKAADGKLTYKSKGVIQSRNPDDITVPKTGDVILQQMLLNYLNESSGSDSVAICAHRFFLWQWYRDDSQGQQNLPFYHGRSVGQTSYSGRAIMPTPFTRDVIVRMSALLGQHRPLARGFDRILERLLVSLQENSPTPRAKALRAVSAIVEVDPGVLGDERVQRAVEGRFLDSAISVREAAMELVGRHIASHPDVAVKYFQKIAERIMDTGVSVRKRVIKIIRDLYISRCDFAKRTDALVRILTRINDEETSIQDLVCRTFYEIWFEEPGNQYISQVGDSSSIPSEISERVQQLVDVLKCLQNPQAMVTIIKRSLALDFIPQTTKNSASTLVSQATVRNRCELMCKCLIEDILKAEERNGEDAETIALPYVLGLHSFCMVDPTLCAPAADPSRYAVTLQSYLKTQIDNRDVAQLLQSIVFVIDTVLPLLRRPSLNFVEELERDLRQLIVRYSFLTVVHACIKCLCTLGMVAAKGLSSFEFLVQKFFKLLDTWRKNRFGASEKPNVLRCLFCLGLLARYGANMIDSMNDKETNVEQLLSLFKHYLLSDDFDVKARSLQALGFFFIARPEFMMEKDTGKMIEATLSSSADSRIKIQTLRNFYDYLADVEEKMGVGEVGDDLSSKPKQDSGVVPVAAGAGDSNICGGIIQLHWDYILEQCLDINDQVRHAAVKVIEIVLRQGLVHPMTCVPHLIALEVDQQEANSKLAHRLLSQMNEKYPSFFESRLGDGLQLSFKFIQSGASTSPQTQVTPKTHGNLRSKLDATSAFSAKAGISRAYKLIRGSRISRNKFISSVVRKFDVSTWGHLSLSFLVYCTEILGSLPFTLPDEPLYLVYAINRMVQVRAGAIEANIKLLIVEGPLGAVAKKAIETIAVQREQENENAYNLDTVKVQKTEETLVDDTDGIPEAAVSKLREECVAAAALALLLRLKRHVKIMYNLSDARCQAFTPTEPIKPGETLSKQNVKEFSCKEILTNVTKTIKQMLEQYQVFKRLLKEDSMDYSTYISNSSKKRNRASLPPGHHIEPLESQVQGHVASLRSSHRRSFPMGGIKPIPFEENEPYSADDFDDDYVDDANFADSDDENYDSKVVRRRQSSNIDRLRRKKHHS